MTDKIADIAAGLNWADRKVIRQKGIVIGSTQFMASIMRPLERRGYFERQQQKGFQVRWVLTELGEQVRNHLKGNTHD